MAMARKAAAVPDAWDDNWEEQADTSATKAAKAKGGARATKKNSSSRPVVAADVDGLNDDDKDTPFSGGALLTEPPAPADTAAATPVLLTRAERLAQHAERNRKLWETADNPEEFHFLAAGGPSAANNHAGVSGPSILSPATAFRPTMTVLSRKPAPQMIRRRDPVTGLEQLTIRDDAAEAEAEAAAAAAAARRQETPEQVRQRQLKEREERQRKYDEARAKIFGEPLPSASRSESNHNNTHNHSHNASAPASMASSRQPSPTLRSGNGNSSVHSPNSSTPSSPQPHGGRGRGRGRGGGGYRGDRGGGDRGDRGGNGNGNGNDGGYNRRGHHQHSSSNNNAGAGSSAGAAAAANGTNGTTASTAAGQGASSAASTQRLFDPGYSPKPGSQRRQPHNGTGNGTGNEPSSPFQGQGRTGTPRDDGYVTRAPRGPDGSGRGGFGFARSGS